jgi:hypothetical protein
MIPQDDWRVTVNDEQSTLLGDPYMADKYCNFDPSPSFFVPSVLHCVYCVF